MQKLKEPADLIEIEIDNAKQFFKLYKDAIIEDQEISQLLEQYRKAIRHTWRTMENLNLTETCGRCSEKEPGGCCFRDVETWYSDVQLLINMLLGIDISMTRKYENSCLFAGDKGCRLLSRNSFCINFLCDKIKNRIATEEINNLNSTAGREIDCGVRLENAVLKWLSQNSIPH